MNRLPLSIWDRIIQHASTPSPSPLDEESNPYTTLTPSVPLDAPNAFPYALSAASPLFHAILTRTPAAWQRILVFLDEPFPASTLTLALTRLARAGLKPTEILLTRKKWAEYAARGAAPPLDPFEEDKMLELMDVLRYHLGEVRSLVIRTISGNALPSIFEFSDLCCPHLVVLEMDSLVRGTGRVLPPPPAPAAPTPGPPSTSTASAPAPAPATAAPSASTSASPPKASGKSKGKNKATATPAATTTPSTSSCTSTPTTTTSTPSPPTPNPNAPIRLPSLTSLSLTAPNFISLLRHPRWLAFYKTRFVKGVPRFDFLRVSHYDDVDGRDTRAYGRVGVGEVLGRFFEGVRGRGELGGWTARGWDADSDVCLNDSGVGANGSAGAGGASNGNGGGSAGGKAIDARPVEGLTVVLDRVSSATLNVYLAHIATYARRATEVAPNRWTHEFVDVAPVVPRRLLSSGRGGSSNGSGSECGQGRGNGSSSGSASGKGKGMGEKVPGDAVVLKSMAEARAVMGVLDLVGEEVFSLWVEACKGFDDSVLMHLCHRVGCAAGGGAGNGNGAECDCARPAKSLRALYLKGTAVSVGGLKALVDNLNAGYIHDDFDDLEEVMDGEGGRDDEEEKEEWGRKEWDVKDPGVLMDVEKDMERFYRGVLDPAWEFGEEKDGSGYDEEDVEEEEGGKCEIVEGFPKPGESSTGAPSASGAGSGAGVGLGLGGGAVGLGTGLGVGLGGGLGLADELEEELDDISDSELESVCFGPQVRFVRIEGGVEVKEEDVVWFAGRGVRVEVC
ncbi:hypothetical protein DFP72DRAFT_856335 [Ephemerocybe angulata]|uniref:Uncharacterized protein n=1 Tax=Ephemerocybe angulata TaxID=980116 RepID=A0A8H6HFY5_9AGAR|nr:hypothetical protein DFP72DRAFT_856335 [Tulosesus angulatus]